MTNIHRLHGSGPTHGSEKSQRLKPRHWVPRGLRDRDAAAYIGVSVSKFRELVDDGKMPPPKRDGGIVVWDREALDLAFDDWGQSESGSQARNSFDD